MTLCYNLNVLNDLDMNTKTLGSLRYCYVFGSHNNGVFRDPPGPYVGALKPPPAIPMVRFSLVPLSRLSYSCDISCRFLQWKGFFAIL